MSCGVPICTICPSIQHGDTVGHRQRLDLIVRDKQRRAVPSVFCRCLKFDPQRFAQFGVQVAQRLIHQKDARIAHHARAQSRRAAFRRRKDGGLALDQVRDAQFFGRIVHALVDLGLRAAVRSGERSGKARLS